MRRYRVMKEDFDTRSNVLNLNIEDSWEDHIKEMWWSNKEQIKRGLLLQYGFEDADMKLKNFTDLGPKAFSVLAYHNRFAEQARHAFIVGAYYPALTGACALGERVLNHLLLELREHFRSTPEYRKVQKKKSFDNWDIAIGTLEAWNVLVPEAIQAFNELKEVRNRRAIHFNPETDDKDREFALDAIQSLNEIVANQFATSSPAPYFIPNVTGGIGFVKKEMENDPFVELVYLSNAVEVGPEHYLEPDSQNTLQVVDKEEYEEEEISDERFVYLYEQAQKARLTRMREGQSDQSNST